MAALNTEAIGSLPLFEGLDSETVGFMAERMQKVSIPIGGHIVKAGDFAYRFFLILEGSAAVSREGVPVATLLPGEVFGEMALVEDARRNADVVAVTPMTVLVLMSWDFREALARLPEFRRRIEDSMAPSGPDAGPTRSRLARPERNMPPVARGPTTI